MYWQRTGARRGDPAEPIGGPIAGAFLQKAPVSGRSSKRGRTTNSRLADMLAHQHHKFVP
jgi:hypothetical protein